MSALRYTYSLGYSIADLKAGDFPEGDISDLADELMKDAEDAAPGIIAGEDAGNIIVQYCDEISNYQWNIIMQYDSTNYRPAKFTLTARNSYVAALTVDLTHPDELDTTDNYKKVSWLANKLYQDLNRLSENIR